MCQHVTEHDVSAVSFFLFTILHNISEASHYVPWRRTCIILAWLMYTSVYYIIKKVFPLTANSHLISMT